MRRKAYFKTKQLILSSSERCSELQPDTSLQPTIEIVTELTILRSLEKEWDELVSNSSGTIFQTFDWQYLWWKHFASDSQRHLLVVFIRENGRLIGIAPFFLQTFLMMGFRIFRQLKLMGSGLKSEKTPVLSVEREGPGDYLDVIAERGQEEKVADSVCRFITDNDDLWDEIELQNLPEDGVLLNHVLPRLQASDFEIAKEPTDVCPKVLLPKSLDEYLGSLRIKVRRNLRHSFRAYFENPDYTAEEFGPEGNLDGALQALSLLHQKRWNMSGYPGLFSDKRFETMQRDLVKTLSKKDRVWIKLLRHEGKPVAGRLGFKFNGQVCDYLSGFEMGQQAGSVSYSGTGMALIVSVIKESIESNWKVFDLARGNEAYKFDLTSTVYQNYRVTLRRKRMNRHHIHMAYRMSSVGYSLLSRAACESEIFKLRKEEKGFIRAVPSYAGHFVGRLSGRSSKLPRLSARNGAQGVSKEKSDTASEQKTETGETR